MRQHLKQNNFNAELLTKTIKPDIYSEVYGFFEKHKNSEILPPDMIKKLSDAFCKESFQERISKKNIIKKHHTYIDFINAKLEKCLYNNHAALSMFVEISKKINWV